jgi:hypothetical protein
MRLLKLVIALIAIAGVAIKAGHLAAATEVKPPVAFYLDEASDAADVPTNLLASAKDVVVA